MKKNEFFTPDKVISLFWVLYSIQSTFLADSFTTQGMFYPFYLIIIANAANIALGAEEPGRLLPFTSFVRTYYVFFMLVLASLINSFVETNFLVLQRLFIFALGLLTAYQFRNYRALAQFPPVQAFSGVILSAWVIKSSVASQFLEHRGGVDVNQNYLSILISLGLLPLISWLFIKRKNLASQICYSLLIASFILADIYAILLLASRGMSVACAVAIIVVIARHEHNFRYIAAIAILVVLVATVIPELPGAGSLLERFSESDVHTLNDRTLLWQATLDSIKRTPVHQLILGQGFMASDAVVSSTVRGLTSTHNSYLQTLFDFGLVGLALFFALHLLVLQRLVRSSDPLAVNCLAAIIFLLVANMTGSNSDNFVFWVVLGYAAVVGSYVTERQEYLKA